MTSVGQNSIFAAADRLSVRRQIQHNTTGHQTIVGQHLPDEQNITIAPPRSHARFGTRFNWTAPSGSAKISAGYNPQGV
jgi:hypothetical protein